MVWKCDFLPKYDSNSPQETVCGSKRQAGEATVSHPPKAQMPETLDWLRRAPCDARRTLLAASLGWALDSFDVSLFTLVLPTLIRDFHLTKASAGLLGSLTLISAAFGGIFFGLIADRFGRTRALIGSIFLYAVFTAACGFAWSWNSLAVFRICVGFGMGGEWASGASLVSETWPTVSRDKALALMQSAFAPGYALAALVSFIVLPRLGWRGVFFAGILPALLTFWIRQHVREPRAWLAGRNKGEPQIGLVALFRVPFMRATVALTLMNACCLFAWWGFNQWVPTYLSLPVAGGGRAFSAATMTLVIVVMQVGMWLGYVSFGYLATAFGRRRVYVSFLVAAAALLVIFAAARSPRTLLVLGTCLAFCATGYFSGFASVTADTYPSHIRSTGQGFTYNLGRLASAAAPFTVGALAQTHGFATAFHLAAAFFILAAILWLFIP
jgi:MFS family permease